MGTESVSLFLYSQTGTQLGPEKGVFWKRGLFKNVQYLEILENLEILDSREPTECGKRKSRDSQELRNHNDSRDASSEKILS